MLNFVDENFKEIGMSSVILPEQKKGRDRVEQEANAKELQQPKKSQLRKTESCHLIGKVNPNILRTWEQLNLFQNEKNQDEHVIYSQQSNFQQPNEDLASFKVNYVTYDHRIKGRGKDSSDLYYDSIDEDEDVLATTTTGQQSGTVFEMSSGTGESIIFRAPGGGKSLMTDSTEALLQETIAPGHGGEGMAEFDSLDKKRLNCWSMENEGEF